MLTPVSKTQFWPVVAKIALEVFLVEGAVMFALPLLGPLGNWLEAVIDASLLALLSAPIIYFSIIRPLDRKSLRLANELIKAEAATKSVLDAAADAIFTLDGDGRIVSFNRAAERTFGYPAAAAIGQSISFCLPPPYDERILELLGEPWQGDGEHSPVTGLEINARRSDGTIFPIDISYSDVRTQNRRIFTAIVRDISDRKRTESELNQSMQGLMVAHRAMGEMASEMEQRNDELREANLKSEQASRAKSEFLANMSHEIRTPMTAIMGFADLLRTEGEANLTPAQRLDAIETIQRNADYLLAIVNDILDLSKIEAGKLVVERIACSPASVVADVLTLMRVRAEAKNLTLTLNFAGPTPASIITDPTRLRQILINLLGNAIKFTESGGVRVVAQLENEPGEPARLAFEVTDSGIGMSSEQIAALFRPFTQADTSTSRKYGGTGLGLTISKRLVEMLGGAIEVSSEPGAGATFRFTIETGPLGDMTTLASIAAPEVPGIKADARSSPAATGKLDCRILLAEDGIDNQRLLSFLLKKAGAQLTLVENGALAVDAALQERSAGRSFDLILMDMQMPVLDGYQAVGQLREHGFTTPIVALTAHAMSGDRTKCLDAGCDDYLTKPIDRVKLLDLVRQWSAKVAVNG